MNKHMMRFLLLTGIGSLAFSLACGGGSGGGFNNGGGGGSGTGNFSTASLSGQYAYQVKGYDLQSGVPFREAGMFIADGSGHITSGKDDFATSTMVSPTSVTGTYQVNSNGIGTLSLSFSDGTSAGFQISLASSSQFYLIEADSALNAGLIASGSGQKQDTTAFSAVPNGTFVLRMHSITSSLGSTIPISTVGAFTVSGGGTVSGSMDNQQFSSFAPSTFTGGSFNTPDTTTGRGTGTFVDSSRGTLTFTYYVVDASHLIFFSTNTGVVGTGVAEKQSGAPFTTASFSGPYAFGSSGDTLSFFEQTNAVGRFNADGSGAITAGVLDAATDGTTTSNLPFTGTYTMDSNGRATVTLGSSSGSIQQVYWMVSPSRAFTVTNSSNSVEDGSVDLQVGSFSNASLSGFYAFEMDGFDNALNSTKQRVGFINANGSGTMSLDQVSNASGAVSQEGSFSGTYSVTSNGRVTGTANSISNNLVFYLVSGSNAYVLQNDSGVAIKGTFTKQP